MGHPNGGKGGFITSKSEDNMIQISDYLEN